MLSGQPPYLDLVRRLENIAPSHSAHPRFSSAADMCTEASNTAAGVDESADGPLSAAVAACGDGVLDVSVGVGYQWIDSPTVGACAIAVVDAMKCEPVVAAQGLADALSGWMWAHRESWTATPVSVEQALAEAEAIGQFPSILADGGDNTGGGAPGDACAILQRFLDSPALWPCCVLYMVDPVTAAAAHAVGAGAPLSVAVGGTSHPKLGPPAIMADATVEAVSDGTFVYDGSKRMIGAAGNLGPAALLRQDGVYVVVVSKPGQPMDLAMSKSLGLDCTSMRYICVKSTGHFRDGFEPIAG